jgi:hypothetical protein
MTISSLWPRFAAVLVLLCPVLAQNATGPIRVQGDDLQGILDRAPAHAVVECDPNHTFTWTGPIVLRKPVTVVGLHAQLPPKLGKVSLVVIEAKGVSFVDFELKGNADSVDQADRAPLMVVHAGEFRIERGTFLNSSKDGVMIDGDGPHNEDVVGGVVRDIIGRDVQRDTVSISGGNSGHRIRNVLVDNVRCYNSQRRGAVEVSDGTDNITVRKVYAEGSIYAVDVQDHKRPKQDNRNIVVEDVFAVRCKHAIRTSNSKQGHTNLTVRDITAQACISPIQISRTANVHVSNVRISEHDGDISPVLLQDCHGVTLRDVTIEARNFKSTAVLLENCDEALVDGVTLRAPPGRVANAVRYRLTTGGREFSGLRITNVAARTVTEAGIVLESTGKEAGVLSDYRIVGNLATVSDRLKGERAILTNNQP